MIGSNTRDYKRDTGENLYRRSMYTFWKRSAPPAAMEVLNAPNRETCTVRRDRTNTPLAALLTLNDVQFVEAARVLAEKTMTTETGDDKRIDFLAKRLLARPFRDNELVIVKGSLDKIRAYYKAKPDEAKKLIAFGESKADPKLDPSELEGGTFTITNGGIFGSLLSTPIVNPPQSGVLGMHAIQDRPVAREGQVVIRPMMYVALTYDHRLVDGREAVTFLVRIKQALEDPSRMLLEI